MKCEKCKGFVVKENIVLSNEEVASFMDNVQYRCINCGNITFTGEKQLIIGRKKWSQKKTKK